MALLFMDSFDHYVTADINQKWTASGVSGIAHSMAIMPTNGRRNLGCWRWNTGVAAAGQSGYLQRTLVTPTATVIMGSAYRPNGSPDVAVQIFSLKDGATTQLCLRLNSDMTMSVVRGTAGGTTLGTTLRALSVNNYQFIEWSALIADSGGTSVVRVNGAVWLTLTVQDTQATTVAQCTSIALGQIDGGNSVVTSKIYDYDDCYVLDGSGAAPNTFLGDCRIDAQLSMTPAGANSGWTPSAGSNWQCVDDTPGPNGDTDYVAATSAGLVDTLTTQNMPALGGTIYGVQQCLSMKKIDTGSATIAPVIRHAGADNVGTPIVLGAPFAGTYLYGLQVAAVNPGTGVAWVEADFNAAEFGYKRVS